MYDRAFKFMFVPSVVLQTNYINQLIQINDNLHLANTFRVRMLSCFTGN